MNKKFLSLIMAFCMVITMFQSPVLAATDDNQDGSITAFDELDNGIAKAEPFDGYSYTMSVKSGTALEDINLPKELTATVERAATNSVESSAESESSSEASYIETEKISVTWESDKEYSSEKSGEFVFSAVLPEGYSLADGVSLPQISVTVKAPQTMLLGIMPLYAGDPVSYLDADGTTKTCTDYTSVASDTTTWNAGWYVVDSDVTISNRITVSGNVHLILVDGKTLTASEGINVASNKSITIYGQANGTGKLTANTTVMNNAGIGGGNMSACGDVTINGGTVTATGSMNGAGIGGGNMGACGKVTINGGTVTATGDTNSAGIGRGNMSQGGNVIITGGNIKANRISPQPTNGSGVNVYLTTYTEDDSTGKGGTFSVTSPTYNLSNSNAISGVWYVYLPEGEAKATYTLSGATTKLVATVTTANTATFATVPLHSHCVCGGTTNLGDHTSHSNIAYTAISSTYAGGSLSGNIYLDCDVTLTSSIIVDSGKTLNLCLNGHKLNANNGAFSVITNNGTLNICDCNENQQNSVDTYNWDTTTGAWQQSDSITVNGGVITGGNVPAGGSTVGGGGICNLGTLCMYGGTIAGNRAANYGGGVHNLGSFTLYGGTIRNNGARSISDNGMYNYGTGGGIYTKKLTSTTPSLTLYGGIITQNLAGNNGAGVFAGEGATVSLAGNTEIYENINSSYSANLYIDRNSKLTIAGALNNTKAIGINMWTPGVFTQNGSGYDGAISDLIDNFTSDSSYNIVTVADDNQLMLENCYAITKAPTTGGSFTVSAEKALENEAIVIIPTAETGYELDKITYVETESEDILTEIASNNGRYSFAMPDYDVTVSVSFKKLSCSVSFDLQGNGSAIASQSVKYGNKITAPASPTANGYTFGGWYKDKACKNVWSFENDTVTSNTTLFAKWTKDSEAVYTDKTIANSDNTATVSGKFTDGAQFDLYPITSGDGYDTIVSTIDTDNNEIIGAYEAKIVGGTYDGQLIITFAIGDDYNGKTITVRHLKADGTIEILTAVCKDGQISITVDELSPFVLTVAKTAATPTATPKPSTAPTDKDSPKTGDSTNLLLWISLMFVSAGAITVIWVKSKKKPKTKLSVSNKNVD